MEDKLKDLWDVVVRLRRECPWDREQTHESMRRFLIKEELGDLLLHVFFHARMAEERGAFGIEDVSVYITDKLKRRHPHVFGETEVSDSDEVITNWETIKCREREGRLLLDGIPKGLPAMLRAHRIQDRARSVGFEWEDTGGVLDKIEEEVAELKREMEGRDPERLQAEMGDLLFSLINLCRYLDLEPNEALNVTNNEFVRRFNAMQAALAADGLELAEATLEQMEEKWQTAKED
jgi:tetrapyrrole methylase family protein/MazG family protein